MDRVRLFCTACAAQVKYSASRIPIRKRMNAADAAVSGHAVDTLINYESVKYFGNEDHEADRGVRVSRDGVEDRERAPLYDT